MLKILLSLSKMNRYPEIMNLLIILLIFSKTKKFLLLLALHFMHLNAYKPLLERFSLLSVIYVIYLAYHEE